ncbi:MAG: Crp/Fnr family transcriptional regulator [Acidobacteria bacterium]|nr:Crp/Fnr family transcriptional regulator [Acidobacteriota bacterium]
MADATPMREEEALRVTPPFSALPPEDRRRLAAFVRVRNYGKGDPVFREGDPSERFHTIVGGRVKIVKFAPQGKELILEIFGAGDPFGAVAAYEGRPFPASAIAMEPTVVLSLSRRDFFSVIANHPEITRGLLLGLTRRLVELTQKLAQISSGGVEFRIASMFLKLADRMGVKEGGKTVVPLALSRQDIADMVGTTIETAIRIMSRWNKDGPVRTERASFVIEDRAALEKLASDS